jgi:hypothetical protein
LDGTLNGLGIYAWRAAKRGHFRTIQARRIVDVGENPPRLHQSQSRSPAPATQFCKLTYDVTFPMFDKVVTKNEAGQSPIDAFLGQSGNLPAWNFSKYLVDKQGHVTAFFPSKMVIPRGGRRLDQSPHKCRDLSLEPWTLCNGFPTHDRHAHCRQAIAERLQSTPPSLRSGHGGCNGNDFLFELTRADHPFDAVLQYARQTETVLRTGDKDGVTRCQRQPPLRDALGHPARFNIGIEIRQVSEAVKEDKVNSWRHRCGSRLQECQISRPGLQAAADRQYPHVTDLQADQSELPRSIPGAEPQ